MTLNLYTHGLPHNCLPAATYRISHWLCRALPGIQANDDQIQIQLQFNCCEMVTNELFLTGKAQTIGLAV